MLPRLTNIFQRIPARFAVRREAEEFQSDRTLEHTAVKEIIKEVIEKVLERIQTNISSQGLKD